MEDVLRCENVCSSPRFLPLCGLNLVHAPVVIIVARFIVSYYFVNKSKEIHYLLPLIQIVNKFLFIKITNDETRDDNNNRRVTT